MRLELLAADLAPVFAEVPADMENFDFAISTGLQPRLWIDAVAHVAMGRDRRTYRFVRDSRVGRVVLAESHDMKVVAAQVTRYVAERIVERQRLMDGGAEPAVELPPKTPLPEVLLPEDRARAERRASIVSGIWFAVSGIAVGLIGSIFVLWDRLVAMWSGD
jgi:hypothetical protein